MLSDMDEAEAEGEGRDAKARADGVGEAGIEVERCVVRISRL